jgi:hypothetical protein
MFSKIIFCAALSIFSADLLASESLFESQTPPWIRSTFSSGSGFLPLFSGLAEFFQKIFHKDRAKDAAQSSFKKWKEEKAQIGISEPVLRATFGTESEKSPEDLEEVRKEALEEMLSPKLDENEVTAYSDQNTHFEALKVEHDGITMPAVKSFGGTCSSSSGPTLIELIEGGKIDAALILIREMPQEQFGLQNIDGDTALTLAFSHKNTEVIILTLIEKMTPEQISLKNNRFGTALMYAIGGRNNHFTVMIIQKTPPDKLSLQGYAKHTALMFAVKHKDADVIRVLIRGIYYRTFLAGRDC